MLARMAQAGLTGTALEAALTAAKRAANHAATHLPEHSPLQTLALGQVEEVWALAQDVAQRLEPRLLDATASRGDLVRFAPTFAPRFAVGADLALRTGREEAGFRYLQLANMSDIVAVTREVAPKARRSLGTGRRWSWSATEGLAFCAVGR
ncbi:hypothetical protein [Novosphingobium sp. BW1]|uniref:hypothetical protein n=1 Tax=Novosphingobium sp. BW1 TaxID=2592621 RepID=UPI0012935534|nr:hypothetical protein [Novosphingobium sp. BW1]